MTYTEFEAGWAQADDMWSEARDTRPEGVTTDEWHAHLFYGAPAPEPFAFALRWTDGAGEEIESHYGTRRGALSTAQFCRWGATVTDAAGHLIWSSAQ